MTSDRATQADILQRVVDRLRAKIPEFTELNCFISDQPTPALWPDGEVCCTISVGEGVFPEAFSAGGGVSTICKQTTLEVTVWLRTNLDDVPSLDVALLCDRGLWSLWEPAVLRALLLEEATSGNPQAWMPAGVDGKGLLRNELAATRTSAPRPDATGEWLGMSVSFAVDFDWRL